MTTTDDQPGRPARNRNWRAALGALQHPALAFVTALLVGSVIIVVADLPTLGALGQALSRGVGAYLVLVVAILLAVGAGVLSANAGRLVRRLAPAAPAWADRAARWGAILLGVLVVYLVLALGGFNTVLADGWRAVTLAYSSLLEGSLGSLSRITAALQGGDRAEIRLAFYPVLESLVASTPYIFAGLAVAVGFRCGLFNIGAEGQLFMGAIFSVYVGYSLHGLPAIIHVPLALAAGALGGALWALPPAILKAKVGAHEVINTIMMNYIAIRLSDWLLNGPMKGPGSANPVTASIEPSAWLPRFFADPIRFHLGFFIALGVAALVGWFLFRTTLGFELRTVGVNPNAARYSGMSITRNYIIAFCLSGALAGLAGANEVLGVNHNLAVAFSAGYGFDSIALALLGKSHPLGVVLASLLFGTLRSGGTRMQNVAKIPVDIIGVVQALVIAFVAAPAIIRALYRIKESKVVDTVFTRGWGK